MTTNTKTATCECLTKDENGVGTCHKSATWDILLSDGQHVYLCDQHISLAPARYGTATKIA